MEYIPEHQGAQVEEAINYQPTDEEIKDVKLVEKAFQKNKKFKNNYDEAWNEDYGMFRGRQWKESRPSYRHAEVFNLIFRQIQSNVPIQMDSRPKFEYLPQEPNDIPLAEILNQVSEADWAKYNWTAEITELLYDANILGTGLAGISFDHKAENGMGAIVFESSDPFYHFPSPKARSVNKDNMIHCFAEPMPLEEIKKKWPNGKFCKPDSINIKVMDLFDKDKQRYLSPSNNTVAVGGDQQIGKDENPEALVITAYICGDYEIDEKEEQTTADDGSIGVKYVQSKKHPKGRKIIICGDVLLEAVGNEYEDGQVPFARVQNYVNQRQFWGISDVEQVKSPQRTFNKLVSFALDVLTLMGNPIWLVGTEAGVDTENLFNSPGLIVETNDITQVRREEGVQLQPYVLQLIDRMKGYFDDISGSSDVSRGVKPEGVTAASAIQSLQDATQTRLRQKARNLDSFLQDIGQMYLSRVFQYYTAPQIFRLTNKDGAMQFFKFHVEHSEAGSVAKFRSFGQGPGGQVVEGEEKVAQINGMLDVRVSTGSALPFAKAEKENKLLALFDRGIIDREEVLKGSEFPNWEAVLQRLTEAEAAQAQQAQAAGAQPKV